jgi:hypothetical protein
VPGQIDLRLNRKVFQTASHLDSKPAGARTQHEGAVDVTSPLAEIVDMGVFAVNFKRLSVCVGKQQGGSDRLAGGVVQNAAFQPIHT